MEKNINIIKNLPNNWKIVRINYSIRIYNHEKSKFTNKVIKKYALMDDKGSLNIKDIDGNLIPTLYFDKFKTDKLGNVIIGIKKEGKEFYKRIARYYDSEKNVCEIIPQEYFYDYGIINKDGVLSIYPSFDYLEFANENACITGEILLESTLTYGYIDIITGNFITPMRFRDANKFYNKRARVKIEDRYGYIDRDKIMTDTNDKKQYAEKLYPQFNRAGDFKNGVATVRIGFAPPICPGHDITIDTEGKYVDLGIQHVKKSKH